MHMEIKKIEEGSGVGFVVFLNGEEVK